MQKYEIFKRGTRDYMDPDLGRVEYKGRPIKKNIKQTEEQLQQNYR